MASLLNRANVRPAEARSHRHRANHGWRQGWCIPSADRLFGIIAMKKKMEEMKLNTTAPKIVITGMTKDGTPGTNACKQTTIDRYEQTWNGLRDFCFLTGDYTSAMLLSREYCPADPPPMSLEAAIHYPRFRVQKEGDPLLHYQTGQPVLDIINGRPIKCRGDWRSANGLDNYRSSIAKLHSHYSTTQDKTYEESCPACVAMGLPAIQQGCGCETHPGAKARYWSRGNVTVSPTFKNHFDQMKKYTAKKYEVRHTIAFTAGQTRDIRDYLLSNNSMSSLMVWTIMILGIKLFGRVEEVLEMKVEDLPTGLFVVTDEDVEALVAELQGKCDGSVQNMVMWDDKDCTDFSPVRALLIWLAMSGIKRGYIFPSLDQLYAKSTNPTDHYGYQQMLNMMKHLVSTVLDKDLTSADMINLIFGTHMLRKTGYGFAEWGWRRRSRNADEVEVAEIAMSARHKDLASMISYVGDNGTLFELFARIDPNDQREKVGSWVPIHLDALERWRSVNKKNLKNNRHISELADWYVFTKAGCLRERMTIRAVCDQCCSFQPQDTAEVQLNAILSAKLADDPETLQLVLALLQQDRCNRDRTHLRNRLIVESFTLDHEIATTAADVTADDATNTTEATDAIDVTDRDNQGPDATETPNPRKRRRANKMPLTTVSTSSESEDDDDHGQEEPYLDREYSTEMAAIGRHNRMTDEQKWREKVALCQALVDRIAANEQEGRLFGPKNLGIQQKHKKFCYNCIGVVHCLHKCHGGNVNALMQASGKKVIDISRHFCPNACPNINKENKTHSVQHDGIIILELCSSASTAP